MNELIKQRLDNAASTIESLYDAADEIETIANNIILAFSHGGTLFVAGNGGSAAQAIHLCEELTGRYRETRPALPALCLCSDAAAMSCIANDFGWEEVFKRQLEAHASCVEDDNGEITCSDILLVLSTSGESANINAALQTATELGLHTIGLLGRSGGASLSLCDSAIVIDAPDSASIQDGHQIIIHAICEVIEAWVAKEMAEA